MIFIIYWSLKYKMVNAILIYLLYEVINYMWCVFSDVSNKLPSLKTGLKFFVQTSRLIDYNFMFFCL